MIFTNVLVKLPFDLLLYHDKYAHTYVTDKSMISRVHNKGKKREYPTLTIPCINSLRKVCIINH